MRMLKGRRREVPGRKGREGVRIARELKSVPVQLEMRRCLRLSREKMSGSPHPPSSIPVCPLGRQAHCPTSLPPTRIILRILLTTLAWKTSTKVSNQWRWRRGRGPAGDPVVGAAVRVRNRSHSSVCPIRTGQWEVKARITPACPHPIPEGRILMGAGSPPSTPPGRPITAPPGRPRHPTSVSPLPRTTTKTMRHAVNRWNLWAFQIRT
mmetsp:Transcript_1488/g.2889  ORF Transcript_1488/g.2889 Transcript_1488/m.2889 type:complete len:209 (-) Transcript_1488:441-1067(-)